MKGGAYKEKSKSDLELLLFRLYSMMLLLYLLLPSTAALILTKPTAHYCK